MCIVPVPQTSVDELSCQYHWVLSVPYGHSQSSRSNWSEAKLSVQSTLGSRSERNLAWLYKVSVLYWFSESVHCTVTLQQCVPRLKYKSLLKTQSKFTDKYWNKIITLSTFYWYKIDLNFVMKYIFSSEMIHLIFVSWLVSLDLISKLRIWIDILKDKNYIYQDIV